jgi:dihydrofolate reductase
MSRVVVFLSITLDGVIQAPGRPDEDTRGGFAHGGWAAPYADQKMGELAAEGMANTGGLLFGRRTYEDFHGFWPNQPEPNPFTAHLNATRKYVASTTLQEPLAWQNSTLLAGDAAEAVAGLRASEGKDLVVLGSGELVRSLARADQIDAYTLLIHPLILGSGRRLFEGDEQVRGLRLVDSQTTTTGVIVANYEPA